MQRSVGYCRDVYRKTCSQNWYTLSKHTRNTATILLIRDEVRYYTSMYLIVLAILCVKARLSERHIDDIHNLLFCVRI